MKTIIRFAAWFLFISISIAADRQPNGNVGDAYRLSTILRMMGSPLRGDSVKISKLLAGKSPDISKEKLQKGWLHYRIWHIGGGWHDGLYDIFISPNGEIEILKTSSADAYKSWKLVIKEPQNSFTNALSAIIDDPIPLLASRSRDGGPDSALTIMERYTNEEGYRWGVRSLYLTTKQSVVDLVQLFKPIDAKLEKIKSEAEGAKE